MCMNHRLDTNMSQQSECIARSNARIYPSECWASYGVRVAPAGCAYYSKLAFNHRILRPIHPLAVVLPGARLRWGDSSRRDEGRITAPLLHSTARDLSTTLQQPLSLQSAICDGLLINLRCCWATRAFQRGGDLAAYTASFRATQTHPTSSLRCESETDTSRPALEAATTTTTPSAIH